jgi:hypothetical protein
MKRLSHELLQSYGSPFGESLDSLASDRPLLLVFLRHFG